MTFSIIGFDRQANEFGVAVQSKMLAVGATVPWALPKVGAVVTQSIVNTSYGIKALQLLQQGKPPNEIITSITKNDELKQLRQVALVNKDGHFATFTGSGCIPWSGGLVGDNYAIQGNRLKNEKVVMAMEQSFKTSTGSLAERLLLSLEAGQAAGGDREGQQAAALLIVKNNENNTNNAQRIDLRVDDHQAPITELKRLYNLYELSYFPAQAERIVPIEGEVKSQLQALLIRQQVLKESSGDLTEALTTYLKRNNFHARIQRTGFIDLDVLSYLQKFND